MARIRVLMADLPGMLADIIGTTLSAQPDMEVVTEAPTTSAPLDAMAVERADVVVVGLRDSELAEPVESLFERSPNVRVLGIAGDGRHAFLHELRPHRVSLGELSPDQLVDVIRAASTGPRLARRSHSLD